MTSKVLCRYHMSGMCNKGADCTFSHDFKAMPAQACRYYLAGFCAYGDECRYDHVRPEWSSAAADRAARTAKSAAVPPPVTVQRPDTSADDRRPLVPSSSGSRPAWQPEPAEHGWGGADAAWQEDDVAWHGDDQPAAGYAFDDGYGDEAGSAVHSYGASARTAHDSHCEAAKGVRDSYCSAPESPHECRQDAGHHSLDESRSCEGSGRRASEAEDGCGGSTDPDAGLCGAFTLSGCCGRRPCHLAHGNICPVRTLPKLPCNYLEFYMQLQCSVFWSC